MRDFFFNCDSETKINICVEIEKHCAEIGRKGGKTVISENCDFCIPGLKIEGGKTLQSRD